MMPSGFFLGNFLSANSGEHTPLLGDIVRCQIKFVDYKWGDRRRRPGSSKPLASNSPPISKERRGDRHCSLPERRLGLSWPGRQGTRL